MTDPSKLIKRGSRGENGKSLTGAAGGAVTWKGEGIRNLGKNQNVGEWAGRKWEAWETGGRGTGPYLKEGVGSESCKALSEPSQAPCLPTASRMRKKVCNDLNFSLLV